MGAGKLKMTTLWWQTLLVCVLLAAFQIAAQQVYPTPVRRTPRTARVPSFVTQFHFYCLG
jgi:hypothetical protein